MTKDLVISANRHETKVAILEDEQLVEIYFQRANEYSLVGSIHKGRVTRVLPGMQSAFVDIGLERDAFLYVSDFFDESEEYEELPGAEKKVRSKAAAKKEKEEVAEPRKERRTRRSRRRRARPEGLPESKYASVDAIEKEEKTPAEEEPVGGIVPLPGESLAKYGGPVPVEEETEATTTQSDSGAGGEKAPEDAAETQTGEPPETEAAGEGEGSSSDQPESAAPAAGEEDRPAGGASLEGGEKPAEVRAEAEAPAAAPIEEESAGEGKESGEEEEPLVSPSGEDTSSGEADREEASGEKAVEDEEASAELRTRDESPLRVDGGPEEEPETAGEENPGGSADSGGPAGDSGGSGTGDDSAGDRGSSPAVGEADSSGKTEEETPGAEQETAGEEQTEEVTAGEKEDDDDEVFPVRTKLLSHRRFARPTRGGLEPVGEDQEIQQMILGQLEEPAAATSEETEPERGAEERKRGRRSTRRRGRNKNASGGAEKNEGQNAASREPESRRAQRSNRRGRRRDRAEETNGAEGGRPNGDRNSGADRFQQPSITELLKEGQEIIVQVAKEPLGQKGARITSHIALPGRYVVYMPTLEHLGVSRKIGSIKERQRLRRILQEKREGMPGGFIVRTAGEGKSEEEIAADMQFLYNLWLDIREKAEKKKAPALLHHDLQVVERVLRDQVNEEFTSIWVDHEETYEEVVRFLERFQPELMKRVRLYTRSEPIFDAFNITQELEKALRPKVWLKSGGYIVINQTEALVAIDINTGKYVGKSNRLEDTIVKTNIEAVKEIVRQIRLRDLGGIIVVDFIDMEERKSRQKVMQALEEAMRADRAPYKILQFNDFGLVAITRKRAKQSLERTLCMPCPYCEGAAYVKSVETVLGEILNEAYKMAEALEGEDVVLRVHPDVAKRLKDPRSGYLEELEEILNRPVLVKADPLLHHEKFDLA